MIWFCNQQSLGWCGSKVSCECD